MGDHEHPDNDNEWENEEEYEDNEEDYENVEEKNLYEILEIDPKATQEEIDEAFKKNLAKYNKFDPANEDLDKKVGFFHT